MKIYTEVNYKWLNGQLVKIDDKSFFSKNILMNDFLTKIDDLKMLDLTGKGLALEIQKLFLELIKKENGTD